MHGRAVTLTATFLHLVIVAGGLSAQEERIAPIAAGSRVRVTSQACALRDEQTVLGSVSGDTLRATSGDLDIRCPLGVVERLEVYRGRGGNKLVGAAVGGALGAGLGLLLVVASPDSDCLGGIGDTCRMTTGGYVAGAVIFGGIGAGLGVLIASRMDHWEQVPLDQLQVSLAPHRDGRLGIGLAVTF